MKLIYKIRNVKVNYKSIIIGLILMIIGVIGYGINYCFYSPSLVNKYIASKLYKEPANSYFDDDNFYQCVVDAYNSKNDTSLPYTTNLSDSQLETITSLICKDKGILNTKGIDKLIDLQYLDLSNYEFSNLNTNKNLLTNLDVGNNTQLIELDVSSNQLTNLDIGNLTALKELKVHNNKLTNLDVSGATDLTYLYASSNQLTKLDVSKNFLLEKLEVYNNQLTNLNVNKNTNLKNLSIGYKYTCLNSNAVLGCDREYGNKIKNLDLSNNIKLEKLDVSYNELTELNLSKNTLLEYLYASNNTLTNIDVSNNKLLYRLIVDYNQISVLDVNNNIQLNTLYAFNNQLTNLDISGATLLSYVDVEQNQLTSFDISQNTALTKLLISFNKLTNLNLNNNISLTHLEASDNQLTNLELSGAPLLSNLYVKNNQLTNLDVRSNTELVNLNVESNKLVDLKVDNAILLNHLDASNNNLTKLDVGDNVALISLDLELNKLTTLNLNNNTSLTHLYVSKNQFMSLDVSKLTSLKYLFASNNQLISLNIGGLSELIKLYISSNQLTNLEVKGTLNLTHLEINSNKLTNLDVSGATKLIHLEANSNKLIKLNVTGLVDLTYLDVMENEITNLEVSGAKNLTKLYASNNQLTSLDLSDNTKLSELEVFSNQLVNLDISGAINLNKLDVSNNQLTTLNTNDNTLLTNLNVGSNQLTRLYVSNNIALTTLLASENQLISLDVSNNTALETLSVYNNELTYLDLSSNIVLTRLSVSRNNFERDLRPILLGDIISMNEFEKMVILPSQLIPNITIELTDGLKQTDDGILTTIADTTHCYVTNKFQNGLSYNENYTIEEVDVKSSKYDIDKTKDYIIVGNDDNDTILSNVIVENGIPIIDGDYLIIKNDDNEVKRFNLIKFSSNVYDLSKNYIYVGKSTNEEIINNIEATADININDNVLSITYGDTYNVSYTLVRLNISYDISNGYIYTFDSNYLDNIDVINGNKEIVDDDLVIKYNDIELDRIPILYVYSDSYIIKEDYIYTGLSDIDLNNINKHKDLDLSINDNKLILTYKDNIIDEIPYYYLISNSNDVRFSTVNNKIYVKNTMMTYNQLLQYITFNSGGQSIMLFDKNDNRVTDNNLLIEEGSYITLYGNTTLKHIIEVNTEYVEYKVGTNIHYTTEYGKDIIKNLNNNNTFINVRDLIETDGELSILDKEDNVLEDTSNIKTGDKVVVTFPSSNKYYIYLSVKGDVTGKGNISNEDVLKSYSILRGNVVEDYYRLASDINDDGKVKINDVAKLYHYVNKKIDSLED